MLGLLASDAMTWWQTILIAIVEGLTEFLPISSTGHMIITQKLLGVESTDFVKAFTVIIQFGAILSVVVLYWRRFFVLEPCESVCPMHRILGRLGFYTKLFVGFLPAAVIGFLCNDYIELALERVEIVAAMLVVGGVFMLYIDRLFGERTEGAALTHRSAFIVGLFQCLAMIPGVSRSMATIVGGLSQKLTRKDAAEFSFFLAVPTMAAATGYQLLKLFMQEGSSALLMDNLGTLLLGCVVSFIVAMLAIKGFLGILMRYGFAAFGWYRIIVGLLIIGLLVAGVDLQMVG